MLCGSRAFGSGFLAIALVEAIDASCGIDQLLFAGKERVASGADFDVQVALFRRARLERLAASAGNCDIDVFWMNSWFHLITLYRRPPAAFFKQDMIGARPVGRQAGDRIYKIKQDGQDSPVSSCKSCLMLSSAISLPEHSINIPLNRSIG